MELVYKMLQLHYEKIEIDFDSLKISISTLSGSCVLTFDPNNSRLSSLFEVERNFSHIPNTAENPSISCDHPELRSRISSLLSSFITSLQPISLSMFDL